MADTCSAEVEMSEDQSTNNLSQSDVGITQNETEQLPEEKASPNNSVLESSATLDDLPSSNPSANEEPVKKVSLIEDSVKKESVNEESFNKVSVNEESFNEVSVNEESINEESVNEESFNEESINEEPVTEEPVNDSGKNTRYKNCTFKTLQMVGIPSSWEKPDAEKFLKIHTKDDPEIAENVINIDFKTVNDISYRCYIIFTTPEIAKRAKMLLENNKVKIFVDVIRTRDHRADIRSRSRSPLGGMGIQDEIDKLKSLNKNEKVLYMRNIPITWNKVRIEKYIRNVTSTNAMIGPNIKYIFMENLYAKFTGVAMVRFANYEACKAARALLKKCVTVFNGQKIWVDYETMTKTSVIWGADDKPDIYQMNLLKQTAAAVKENNNLKKLVNFKSYQSEGFQQKEKSYNAGNFKYVNPSLRPSFQNQINSKSFKNDLVLAGHGPQDTYGLSIEFLKSQGIQPPLWSKIFVGNLDAQYEDETKIRKLFGHAGMVMSVAIIGKIGDTLKLKVEYDHPVEAVQAVCMFHDQEVYSKRLVVQMDRSHNAKKRFLPEGLKSFGPGLGLNGMPLKGVRSSVDLQLVKNTIMEEITKLRQEINQIHQGNKGSAYSEKPPMQTTQSESGTNLPVNADPMAALTTALANAAQNNPLSALSSILNPQAVQMLQILSQPTAAHNLGSVLQSAQGQSFNNQAVAASTSGWNLQSQATDVSQNMQTGYMNTQSGSNAATMQSGTFMHGGLNMQGGASMHSGQVLQDGSNMQGVANMQGWSNVQDVASMQNQAMQGGSNMQGVASMQVGLAMQGGTNMQVGPAMQGGASMQSGPVMQGGASMQSRPIMQGGLNMQAELNKPGGLNMQGRLQSDPNMQGGFNMQGGSNIQSASNMHSGSAPNNNYGGGQHNNLRTSETVYNNNSDRNRKTNDPSATVLFNYLPPSVTLPALHTKMREVGDVKQVEMTGPGRAVVVFYSLRDAEACIKLLDRTRVDGQTIDVRFL